MALIGALLFALLDVSGVASDEAVRAATLVVLAAISGALIRVLTGRGRIRSEIETLTGEVTGARGSIETLQAAVNAIEGGEPWRVVDSKTTYDMESRDVTRFRKWRLLRFYRNDVLSLYDWFAGDGKPANEHSSPGKFIVEPKQVVDGKEYSLIFLPQKYKRADEQAFTLTRDIRGGFPDDDTEEVGLDIIEETEHAVLEVVWPPDKPPTAVRVSGKRIPAEQLSPSALQSTGDGRLSFSYELERPRLGDSLSINWDW